MEKIAEGDFITRKIFCPHCNRIEEHIIKKRVVTFIEGDCFVVFIKRCNKTESHAQKQNPDKNGFRTDAIRVLDWNSLIKNDYL